MPQGEYSYDLLNTLQREGFTRSEEWAVGQYVHFTCSKDKLIYQLCKLVSKLKLEVT